MEKEKIEILLASILMGEPSLEEKKQFGEWYNASDENRALYQFYKRVWNIAPNKGEYHQFNASKALNGFMVRVNHKEKSRHHWRYAISWAVGVVATLLVVFGLNWLTQDEKQVFGVPQLMTVEVPRGDKAWINLPDGTKVMLNAESSLKYYSDFGREHRKIYLSGEAMFDVTHQDNPFLVDINNKATVKVLGTQFNITAYPDEEVIETTLKKGKVHFQVKEHSQLVKMKPGECVKYSPKDNTISVSNVDINQYCGWVDNWLIIRDESLKRICKRLSRRFDVDFIINPEIANQLYHFDAAFKDESLEEVLDALTISGGLKYKLSRKEVIIDKK
ncbi:FecR family protein [Prolixibacteraceae bacterium JC049]|nr:FecR family protein [Prolixibacteraceae bacterium JC049]